MTKPAINVNQSYAGAQTERYYQNGVMIQDKSRVVTKAIFVDTKPASINNAIRPDGTRAPANWSRRGGMINGVRGQAVVETHVGATAYKRVWEGQLASPGFNPGGISPLVSDGELQAIRQALGRFGDAEAKLGAALKETRQTANLLGDYYRGAAQLTYKLESAVRGSKRVRQQFRDFARNGWRDVPSKYLEYLFGIKPLADDLTNAVQVLHDRRQHGGQFNMTLRGKYRSSSNVRMAAYQSWVNPVSKIEGDVAVTQQNRASLVFQLPSWYWERLPPVTFFRETWETTRLSFVLDWVLPVNSWLAGFEGNQLRPFFREGSRSTFLRRTLSGAYDASGTITRVDAAGGSDYTFYRTAFTSFPTAELFQLPRFRDTLGLDQLRVGSALLGQRLASLARSVGRP
jgi:hypothetical protein